MPERTTATTMPEATDAAAATAALELADWRRQVAELYGEVRRLASRDPRAAWERWRTARERLYREHPQSPVAAAERGGFRARHFPYDPGLRFELPLLPADGRRPEDRADAGPDRRRSPVPGPGPLRLPTSAAPVEPLAFGRVGWLAVPFPAGTRRLALFRLRDYAGGLFLPVGDATNGAATYGAGRYVLDTAKGADLGGDAAAGTLVVDFNFAFQPSCAFDPRWACPLAPAENRLDLPIEAGERLA